MRDRTHWKIYRQTGREALKIRGSVTKPYQTAGVFSSQGACNQYTGFECVIVFESITQEETVMSGAF